MSKRGVEETCEALFGVPIALGTVANLEREMSRGVGVGPPRGNHSRPAAPVKYVDETGWKQAGRKRWLWAAATTKVAVFIIDVFRNVTALRRLLGPTLSGILCSDRWSRLRPRGVAQAAGVLGPSETELGKNAGAAAARRRSSPRVA